jgi:hypothetical protein
MAENHRGEDMGPLGDALNALDKLRTLLDADDSWRALGVDPDHVEVFVTTVVEEEFVSASEADIPVPGRLSDLNLSEEQGDRLLSALMDCTGLGLRVGLIVGGATGMKLGQRIGPIGEDENPSGPPII